MMDLDLREDEWLEVRVNGRVMDGAAGHEAVNLSERGQEAVIVSGQELDHPAQR